MFSGFLSFFPPSLEIMGVYKYSQPDIDRYFQLQKPNTAFSVNDISDFVNHDISTKPKMNITASDSLMLT